jgi:tripartite-type tricarboxylate transporter receptor subunit TctC
MLMRIVTRFLLTDGAILAINPLLYANLNYDPKAVVPIAMLARAPLFLAVHPKVEVTSMSEFITYAKARPGQLNYGSSGLGSTHHLSMEAMATSLRLEMTHVPFKGPESPYRHCSAAISRFCFPPTRR